MNCSVDSEKYLNDKTIYYIIAQRQKHGVLNENRNHYFEIEKLTRKKFAHLQTIYQFQLNHQIFTLQWKKMSAGDIS